jgi:hypothetical protein
MKKQNLIQRTRENFEAYRTEIVLVATYTTVVFTALVATYYKGKSDGTTSYKVDFWTDGSHVTYFQPPPDQEKE